MYLKTGFSLKMLIIINKYYVIDKLAPYKRLYNHKNLQIEYRSKNKSHTYKLEIKLQGPCKKFLLLKPHKLCNIGKTFTIMCRLHLYTQDFVYLDDIVSNRNKRNLNVYLLDKDKTTHQLFTMNHCSENEKIYTLVVDNVIVCFQCMSTIATAIHLFDVKSKKRFVFHVSLNIILI